MTAELFPQTKIKAPRKNGKPRPQVIQTITRDHIHVAGMDPALGRFGYCAPDGSMHSIVADKLPAHPTANDLARRLNQIKNLLVRQMRHYPPMPTIAFVEGGFFAHPETSARLEQIRGVLYEVLFSLDIEIIVIPPKSVKLFAADDAEADKTLMKYQAASKIRAANPGAAEPANDDEADAWHLRRMGRVGLGLEESVAGFEVDALHGNADRKIKGPGVRWPVTP